MSRLDMLNSMLAEDPYDGFLIFAIAKEFEKAGDVEGAIQKYEELKSKDPEYVGLYYHLAHLYAESDQLDKAMEIYDQGITIAKKQSDFHALSELAGAKKNLEMENL